MTFQKKVFDLIEKHNMIDLGCEVILGLSGGADSVALFFVLLEYRQFLEEKYHKSFRLRCVYVHHMIRDDADRDVELVTRLCGEQNIPLFVEKRDVTAEAKELSQTVEEAGRRIRYAIFEKYAKEAESDIRPAKIAVAHHMDDQAETVLFNMVRGTGITGLSGMQPVTGNIIRPLLGVTKAEILGYVKSLGKEYITDSTNSDVKYSRNRLRNETIPSLAKINDRAVEHIAAAAEKLAVAERFMEQCAAHEYDNCVKIGEYMGVRELHLVVERYNKLDEALKDLLIMQLLCDCAGRSKDIGEVHVKSVESLAEGQTGRFVMLPYAMTAHRTGDTIVVRKNAPENENENGNFNNLSFTMDVKDIDDVAEISRDDTGKIKVVKKECTKFFDYDKITGCVHMKSVDTSDEMIIDRYGHKKKVGRIFIDEKIPAYRRKDYCAICDERDILWIPGLRDAFNCRVDESTRRVAVITVTGQEVL